MAYILQLWIFIGALGCSSNALDHWNSRCTEVAISASLKSEVVLSCHFNISFDNETVTWSHFSNGAFSSLLRIMHNGSIYFDSSKRQVSVFPLLFNDGNFSILIHDLEPSDIGPYFCELSSECRRVEIRESERPVEKTVELNSYLNSWLFFFAGAGFFTLLFIVFKCTGLQNRCMRYMRSSSCIKEHDEAFRTPDPNDSITTVYGHASRTPDDSTEIYVNQARRCNRRDADKSGK